MAWYYGKFSCGHEGRVNVIGPHKQREWKIERAFSGVCADCYKEQLQKKIEEENKKALEETKRMELPALKGTEKQVAWANALRIEFINQVNAFAEEREQLRGGSSKKADRYRATLNYILNSEEGKKASYWIDIRNTHFSNILNSLREDYKNNFVESKEAIREKELKAEATVIPAEVKHEGIVEIKRSDYMIRAVYEKNQEFIQILKDLKFEWIDACWVRNITEFTGSFEDRIAELGYILLKHGFRVCILDNESREKAIKGDYKVECKRWIKYNPEHNKLALTWSERNQSLYEASRKIKTSTWDSVSKCVLIDVSHFEEVETFAAKHNFNFSKAAIKHIEEYKNILDQGTKL